LLQVVPAKKQSAAAASDDAVKDRVSKALKADGALEGSSISVQSVNDGVALLGGEAKTMSAHLRAVEDASRVPGVRRVTSEIKSPDALADAEIRRDETRGPAKHANERNLGGAASDMWITSATKMRLLADSATPALDINVDTRDGVVTLFGMVRSAAAKRAAEADARKVDGVKQVMNELQVVPKSKQEMVKASDEDIERSVEQAIDKYPTLEQADVEVEVKNGVVRLSGSVPTEQDRLQAAVAARSARGVRSVVPDALLVSAAK
jgi:osmotically-inducible protein OsmY